MKLGILGPSDGDSGALARATDLLLHKQNVDRAVYLGADRALDHLVLELAKKLVGDDPSDDAAWTRAAELALVGTAKEIDQFLVVEKKRRRLASLESLPGAKKRAMEMLGDRVGIFLFDKAELDEDDISAAHLFIYGKSTEAVVKRVGSRFFISPGPAGIAIIDDAKDELTFTRFAVTGEEIHREVLGIERTTKMRIQGGA